MSNVSTVPSKTLISLHSETTHILRQTIASFWRSDLHEGQKNSCGEMLLCDPSTPAVLPTLTCTLTVQHFLTFFSPSVIGFKQMGQVWISLGTRLFTHGGRVWNTAHTRVVLRAPHMGCRISRCEPLCLHYAIIIAMRYVITLYSFYITHRNYNDIMYTLWFPPTYGPLARRTGILPILVYGTETTNHAASAKANTQRWWTSETVILRTRPL